MALKPMTATFNTTVRQSLPGTSRRIRDVELVRGRDPLPSHLFISAHTHLIPPSLPRPSSPTSEISLPKLLRGVDVSLIR